MGPHRFQPPPLSLQGREGGAAETKIIVRLVFSLSQHSRDESLVRSFVAFFGCGTYSPSSLGRTTVSFQTYKFSDNYDKIMPFFLEYNIRGIKSQDFKD